MPARAYGGPAESVYRLCLNLAAAGCEVEVLTTNSNGIGRSLNVKTGRPMAMAAGFDVRYLRRLARHAVAPSLLLALLPAVSRAEVVHLTGVYSFPTIPALIATAILRKPLVWSPRGALQRWSGSRHVTAKRAWELACRPLAAGRTILHVTSEAERLESQRRFRGLDTAVIPNGVRMPGEPVSLLNDGTLRIGFLGRLDPKKGLENLLEACAIVMANGKPFTLTIAGGGPERYARTLRERVERLGLGARVRFAGEVYNRAKKDFFAGINLLAVPSHTENFAMVIAEALAVGIPVIASRGTPWAALEDQRCGLWVDNSPAALAQALERMREAPLAAMGMRGRAWMAADFSWGAVARAMGNIYSSLAYGERMFNADAAKSSADPEQPVTPLVIADPPRLRSAL
jgi:glycosyltransferase involved in cell wall biosynthesis